MSGAALLACLGSTLFMTGLVWFVHGVHYPLLERVGADGFRAYHDEHMRRTRLVVAVPMVVELVSSLALVAAPPPGGGRGLACAGLAAAAVAWVVTVAWAVPYHERMAATGFDARTHRSLMAADLIRAAAWTAHAGVTLAMTAAALHPA